MPTVDFLHFHSDFLHFPAFRHLAGKCVTTLHGRLDLPDFWPAFDAFPEMKLVSISDNQRAPVPKANFVATVYHGMPLDLIQFDAAGGDYLAFIGRISPEKRPDRAIEIAMKTGVKLKMAAKIDPADQAYFTEVTNPCSTILGRIHRETGKRPSGIPRRGSRLLSRSTGRNRSAGDDRGEAAAPRSFLAEWIGSEVIENGRSGSSSKHRWGGRGGRGRGAASSRHVRGAFEARFSGERWGDYFGLYER